MSLHVSARDHPSGVNRERWHSPRSSPPTPYPTHERPTELPASPHDQFCGCPGRQWGRTGGLEDAAVVGCLVARDRSKRRADGADANALYLHAQFRLLVVAARLHVLDPRQQPLPEAARLVPVAAYRRLQQRDMMTRKHVRAAGDPARDAPEEVVERLVVRTAAQLVALAVALPQGEEAREVAARLFYGNDLGHIDERVEALEAELHTRTRREVVEHDRQANRTRDFAVVRG